MNKPMRLPITSTYPHTFLVFLIPVRYSVLTWLHQWPPEKERGRKGRRREEQEGEGEVQREVEGRIIEGSERRRDRRKEGREESREYMYICTYKGSLYKLTYIRYIPFFPHLIPHCWYCPGG